MESTFQKISRKTGKKPSQCKCRECKQQCRTTSCLPTPEDVHQLIAAGHKDRLRVTIWAAGMRMGVTNAPVQIIAPFFDQSTGACTFFREGLCELHTCGLKPTEGKLSHHTVTRTNLEPKKSIAWAVAKEWMPLTEAQIDAMLQ